MKGDRKNLLMIFTRNPELGKCKTRLAADVGNETALKIYTFLLKHTAGITRSLTVDKVVYYSDMPVTDDLWDEAVYLKKIQQGADLGQRMADAFSKGFEDGYENIIVIGSDLYDLNTEDLYAAFEKLKEHDYVLGPARDGGYYLLGMTRFNPGLFVDKNWGKDTVLKDTLANLEGENYFILPERNDIDVLADIIDNPVFLPFIKDKL